MNHNLGSDDNEVHARRIKLDKIRSILFQELGGTKCTNCGYNQFRSLVIAYKERNTKRTSNFTVYQKFLKNIEQAKEELTVLCYNCLRRRMNRQRKRNPVGDYHRYGKQYDLKQRQAIMKIINQPVCNNCWEQDFEVLEIVYIIPSVSQKYKDLFKSKRRVLRYYISQPEMAIKNLRILCCNCNHIRQHKFRGFDPISDTESTKTCHSLA